MNERMQTPSNNKRGTSQRRSSFSRLSKTQQRTLILRWVLLISTILLCIVATIFVAKAISKGISLFTKEPQMAVASPEILVDLIEENEYSRPGIAITNVNGIVIHYTANPGTSAKQNRDYFDGLKETHLTKASSHFVVGLEGEIVQCVPTTEMSYASNDRNVDTISIECCHMDETGEFNQATYDSLVKLTAFLMGKYKLSIDQVIRHYDVTEKACPLYYVENPEKWDAFKKDVEKYIEENGVPREEIYGTEE